MYKSCHYLKNLLIDKGTGNLKPVYYISSLFFRFCVLLVTLFRSKLPQITCNSIYSGFVYFDLTKGISLYVC